MCAKPSCSLSRSFKKRCARPSCSLCRSILDKCGVGSDRLQRARHNPLRLAPPRRREVVFLRAPLRAVFVPITHYLVHAATVHNTRQVAHMLYEVTKERGAWPHFKMVDVAIQGLLHSIDELCHGTKSPPQVLQNSLRRQYAKVRLGCIMSLCVLSRPQAFK